MKHPCALTMVIAACVLSSVAAPSPTLEQRAGLHVFETIEGLKAERRVDAQHLTLTSPIVHAGFDCTEAILSWNTKAPDGGEFSFEIAPIIKDEPRRFYALGTWCKDNAAMRRKSYQKDLDEFASVSTDTLVLKRPVKSFVIRVTLSGPEEPMADWIQFLSVAFSGPRAAGSTSPAVHNAADGSRLKPPASEPERIELTVPALSQLSYAGGKAWCSPTSLAMVLNYWSARLDRTDLGVDVPATAASVFDPDWGGTGNWSFNTAFAGTFPGMRACVARFENLESLKTCLSADVPVVASVSYNRLKGLDKGGSGHLVVVIGFEANGNPLINDPGTSEGIRRIIPVDRFKAAWAESKNTVYLVAPADRHARLLRSLRLGLAGD